jgi:hypothetical protein
MTSPALTTSGRLGQHGIERPLPIGDALHLGDELVTIEDPYRMELLKREDAFLPIGQRRLLGAFGRIRSHVARPFEGANGASARAASASETRITVIRSSCGSKHRRQPKCLGSAEVVLQPAGLGKDLSRGDSQAPTEIAAPIAETPHPSAYYAAGWGCRTLTPSLGEGRVPGPSGAVDL